MAGKKLFVSTALFVVLCGMGVSHACMCLTTHMHEHFCRSDYVVRLVVNGQELSESFLDYNVRILQVYKGDEDLLMNITTLRTAPDIFDCAGCAVVGQAYLLGGSLHDGALSFHTCSLKKEWGGLPVEIKRSLNLGLYDRNCQCVEAGSNWCSVSLMRRKEERCYQQYSFCQWQEGENDVLACDWRESSALTRCLSGTTSIEPHPIRTMDCS